VACGSSPCGEGGQSPTRRQWRRNERRWRLRGRSVEGRKRRGGLARLEGGGGPREEGKKEWAGLEGKVARHLLGWVNQKDRSLAGPAQKIKKRSWAAKAIRPNWQCAE
jgi:hypothetical protein